MSIFLEISQLDNGDVVLCAAEDGETESVDREPIVRIRFSDEVRDMLGGELVGVAEAMIDAATDFLDNLDSETDSGNLEPVSEEAPPAQEPVIVH